MYRYISCESYSPFDLLPLISPWFSTARWRAQIVWRVFARRASRLLRHSFDAWSADAKAGVSSYAMLRTLVRRRTCCALRNALHQWKVSLMLFTVTFHARILLTI